MPQKKSSSHFKKFLVGTLSLLLRTTILVLLLEGVLRLVGVTPDIPLTNPEGPFEIDPNLKWRLKTNYQGNWSGVSFETNGLGLRDDEIPLEKSPHETRVLVMGGSITTGYAMERPQPYVDQLEELFERTQANPITFVNAGIPGYSTFQTLQLLQELGPSLRPDMVLVDFSLNDVTDKYLNFEELGGSGEFRGGGAFFRFQKTPSPLQDLPRYSSLYTAARWLKVNYLSKELEKKELDRQRWLIQELFKDPPSPMIEKAWSDTENDLLKILEITRSQNIPLVILTFPLRQQINPKTPLRPPQKRIENFCMFNQIPFIDLLGPFQKMILDGTPLDFLFLDDDHPTIEGHHLAATVIHKNWPKLLLKPQDEAEISPSPEEENP
jgi:hypothetical protein